MAGVGGWRGGDGVAGVVGGRVAHALVQQAFDGWGGLGGEIGEGTDVFWFREDVRIAFEPCFAKG